MNRLLLTASFVLFALPASAQNMPRSPDGWYQEPVQPVQQQSAYPAATDYYATQGNTGYDTTYQDTTPVQQTTPVQTSVPNSADDFAVSAGVNVVTDYVVRGVSRSDGPALQGHAKLNYNGAYAGVSGSTVDMSIDDGNIEAVLFGGYKGTHDSGIDYDGRLSYFAYPDGDNDDMDYWEFSVTGGYDFSAFYGSLTWALSPNYINDSGVTLYYGADVNAPLPVIGGMDLTARGHLGFQFIGDDNRYVDDNAMDWLIGLGTHVPDYGVDIGLDYVGTSLDDNDCTEDCGSKLLLSAGKSFGW